MKKTWSIVLGLVVMLVAAGAGGCGAKPDPDMDRQKRIQLEKRLDDLLEARYQHYEILEKEISLQFISFSENEAEAEYLIRVITVLRAATPAELPAMRGMLKYLEENRSSLSPEALREVEKHIAFWDAELRELYLGVPHEGYEFLKISAEFDGRGTIKDESVRIYHQDPEGEYLPLDLDTYIQSEEDLINQWYQEIKRVAESRGSS